jgi:multicomponent Na+:H+ antiporter subunit D
MSISNHLPALQVLIPFFAALFCTTSFNKFYAWIISTISIALSLILTIYTMPFAKEGISYVFGNWQAPFGIEYRLDSLNQPILIYINAILLFFLVFGRSLIESTVIRYIDEKKQHLFYALLLFAHTGYIGVISTNDLFNLYVFIEISSLATYVMMSKGKTPEALVGAFDYLMLGTIGATLILIGIGFLLAITGSLNITDIAHILKDQPSSRLVITAIVFFLSGAILKMAFFPMHFWMVRAYSFSPPFILTYLAAISGIMGVYLIMRFMHFTVDAIHIQDAVSSLLRPVAMATIIICTFLSLRAADFKKVVIYSTASVIGYVFLLLTINEAQHIMFQLLILDGLNKVALFTIIALIQQKTNSLNFHNFIHIEKSILFKTLCAFIILFSAGLPLTSMFIVKIQIFDLLLVKNLITEFVVVLLGSVFALLYHGKLVKAIFFTSKNTHTIEINSKQYALIAIVIIQFLTLFFISDIATIAGYTIIKQII